MHCIENIIGMNFFQMVILNQQLLIVRFYLINRSMKKFSSNSIEPVERYRVKKIKPLVYWSYRGITK
jgi:hypothetical protein